MEQNDNVQVAWAPLSIPVDPITYKSHPTVLHARL